MPWNLCNFLAQLFQKHQQARQLPLRNRQSTSQIKDFEKMVLCKRLSWWRRIKSLQRNIFLFSEISLRLVCKKSSWRHLEEDILQTHTEDVLKMSWRHLWKTSCKHVLKTSGRRFEYVLGNEKIYYSHQCIYGWESMLSYFNKNYLKSGSHV